MLIGIPASVTKTKKSHKKSKTPIISNSYTQHVSSTAVKTIQYNTGQASDETHADGELRNSHKERRCGETHNIHSAFTSKVQRLNVAFMCVGPTQGLSRNRPGVHT
jgi:hypothetical protein